jgi:FkbM family methyltransferase
MLDLPKTRTKIRRLLGPNAARRVRRALEVIGRTHPDRNTATTSELTSIQLGELSAATELRAGGLRFEPSPDGMYAIAGDVRVRIETVEELQILREIYLDGIYNFDLSGPLLIVDIGMNVAYASLYFADRHPDSIICGYEPFGPTFACALANIQLNPFLERRIRMQPFGLSDCDRTVRLPYSSKWRGSVGLYGVYPGTAILTDRLEDCHLKDVAVELEKLVHEFPGRRIVLKVDCEGSEYSIIDRLSDVGLLRKIDLMMIECHRRAQHHDPVGLAQFLAKQGFAFVHLRPNALDISMLYVTRTPVQCPEPDHEDAQGHGLLPR